MFFNFTKLNHCIEVLTVLPLSYQNIFPRKLWMSAFAVLKSIVLVKQHEEDKIKKVSYNLSSDLISFKRNKMKT